MGQYIHFSLATDFYVKKNMDFNTKEDISRILGTTLDMGLLKVVEESEDQIHFRVTNESLAAHLADFLTEQNEVMDFRISADLLESIKTATYEDLEENEPDDLTWSCGDAWFFPGSTLIGDVPRNSLPKCYVDGLTYYYTGKVGFECGEIEICRSIQGSAACMTSNPLGKLIYAYIE